MRLLLFFRLLVLSVAVLGASAQSVPRGDDQLHRLHEEFAVHYGNHDDATVHFIQQRFLNPFILVHKKGEVEIVNLQHWIAENRDEAQTDPGRQVSTKLSDISVHVYGDTAVITSHYETQVSGSKVPVNNRSISGTDIQTWVRRDGEWKIISMATAGSAP